jgi:hypothetical protein
MLEISTGAVRNRLSRGTLPSTKESGTVYVLLAADTSRDAEGDTDDTPGGIPPSDSDVLTSELRDRLRYVEGQLEAERQAHAEARRLLAAALERIPAIEAPQETSEAAETVDEQQRVGASPTPMPQAPQMPCSGRGGAGCSGEGAKHGPKNEDHGADRGRVGQEPPPWRRRHHRQRHYIH